jgi:hypothetical protein
MDFPPILSYTSIAFHELHTSTRVCVPKCTIGLGREWVPGWGRVGSRGWLTTQDTQQRHPQSLAWPGVVFLSCTRG